MQKTSILVVYDSITNSVFESQVVLPLARSTELDNTKAIIVSFEKSTPAIQHREYFTKKYPRITLKIFRRLPYGGLWTLWPAIFQLRKLVKYCKNYMLIARGPHAGYVCLKARSSGCTQLVIQVRGLVADEYKYTYSVHDTGLKKLWHLVREKQLRILEKEVYSKLQLHKTVILEAVSKALKEHLVNFFGCLPEKITLAYNDLPIAINPAQRIAWRQEMRKNLAISENALVYCYNGSAKAWQCPEMTINFFKQKYSEDSTAVLLLLTQDAHYFNRVLEKYDIPKANYRVITVCHTEIYRYLAAADVGIIVREQNIINWVSRPTKLLEYQAVGLSIAHNNTIESVINC